ncbi:MAG: precorrin-6y C5,15-methyltransferase (decarboxylating) subunit CbiE [Clostridiales bacterium]|nr:precorrin-6y C5,15-methyltransferase (decarboxylating) subunit CbiE [Clostridiales bacterium]
MNKIWVIGLGPGHPDYMLPIAKRKLLQAKRVYGGKRHLETYNMKGDKVQIKIPLFETIEDIKSNYRLNQTAVLVSGDTGFYSFLEMLKEHFSEDELETYPGISSLQYLFSKLNMSYHNAYIGSVHGRAIDDEEFRNYNIMGLLTDKKQGPKELMDKLRKLDLSATLFIGENLSYSTEKITAIHTSEEIERTYSSLCVVVIKFD